MLKDPQALLEARVGAPCLDHPIWTPREDMPLIDAQTQHCPLVAADLLQWGKWGRTSSNHSWRTCCWNWSEVRNTNVLWEIKAFLRLKTCLCSGKDHGASHPYKWFCLHAPYSDLTSSTAADHLSFINLHTHDWFKVFEPQILNALSRQ